MRPAESWPQTVFGMRNAKSYTDQNRQWHIELANRFLTIFNKMQSANINATIGGLLEVNRKQQQQQKKKTTPTTVFLWSNCRLEEHNLGILLAFDRKFVSVTRWLHGLRTPDQPTYNVHSARAHICPISMEALGRRPRRPFRPSSGCRHYYHYTYDFAAARAHCAYGKSNKMCANRWSLAVCLYFLLRLLFSISHLYRWK